MVDALAVGSKETAAVTLETADKAAYTLSVFVLDEQGKLLTPKYTTKTAAIGAKAWYEIENGQLYIRTNLSTKGWTGYSGTVRLQFSDGSTDHENGGDGSGIAETARYNILTLPHNKNGATVVRVDYLVYDSWNGGQGFWELYGRYDYCDFEAAVKAYSEHIVARFTLDTTLRVVEDPQMLELQSLAITYSDDGQKETYTAVLSQPVSEQGIYGLHYLGTSGEQYAGMTAIHAKGDMLQFACESHHFAPAGASGEFTVSYATHRKLEDGSIVCEKKVSNPVLHTFAQ